MEKEFDKMMERYEKVTAKYKADKEMRQNLEEKLTMAKLHKEKDEERLEETIDEFGKNTVNEYEEEVIKAYKERIIEDDNEINKIEEDIKETQDSMNCIASDKNIKMMIKIIQCMDNAIEEWKIELAKSEIELREFYLKEDKEGKTVQDFYNEQDEIRNNIKGLEEEKSDAGDILDMMKKVRDELIADGKYEEINAKAEEIYMDPDGSGKDESGKDEQGKDESGKDEAGKDESGKDGSGKDESGKDEQGKDESGKDEAGKDESGKDGSGKDGSGKDEQGKDESGKDEQGKDESGKDDPEEVRKQEIRDNSQKVRIAYSAKENVFLIENRNGQYKPFRRTMEEINAISLEELAKKMGKEEKNFENIGEGTILMLKVLSCYDEKFYTNKAEECLELQGGYKVKSSERNEKMNKKGINIEINLKGLYAKEKRISKYVDREKKVSDEDRKKILAVAKDIKKTGTGIVKEGVATKVIKTTGKTGEKIADSKIAEMAGNLGEMAGNIFSNIKGKVKLPKVKLPKLLKSPKENTKVDTKAQEADIEEKVAKAAAKMLDDEKKQKEASKDPGKKLGVKAKSNEEAAREEAAVKAAAKMLDDEKQKAEQR